MLDPATLADDEALIFEGRMAAYRTEYGSNFPGVRVHAETYSNANADQAVSEARRTAYVRFESFSRPYGPR
jgi:hypothetical protein